MSRNRYEGQECPIAAALNEIGDWWTLLVVREAIYGHRHFEDFRRELGVARNILSDRLTRLCDAGILERKPDPEDARATLYELTPKGRALGTVLAALVLWSNRWVAEPGEALMELKDGSTGEVLTKLSALTKSGALADMRGIVWAPGPGATRGVKQRIAARETNRPTSASQPAPRKSKKRPKRLE